MKRECILDIVLLLLTHVLVRVFSTKRKRRKGKNRERDYYTTIKKIFVCVRVVILFACVYYIKFILVMTI
jgi:hypothetical protein